MRRGASPAVHGADELRRESKLVRAKTRASLMSDTKWRKLLSALDRTDLELRHCVIKFVGMPDEREVSRPAWHHPPGPWIDTIDFGPIPLRSIEWLMFPRVAEVRGFDRSIPSRRIVQDIEAAARIIESLGRYPVELSDRGLRIIGYLPDTLGCASSALD